MPLYNFLMIKMMIHQHILINFHCPFFTSFVGCERIRNSRTRDFQDGCCCCCCLRPRSIDGSVASKGQPHIYLNNKLVRFEQVKLNERNYIVREYSNEKLSRSHPQNREDLPLVFFLKNCSDKLSKAKMFNAI